MNTYLHKLWNDDAGALIAAEYLFIATLLVIGIIVGFVVLRDAMVSELTELSNSYLSLSQGYSYSGIFNECPNASVDGSQNNDPVDHVDADNTIAPYDNTGGDTVTPVNMCL